MDESLTAKIDTALSISKGHNSKFATMLQYVQLMRQKVAEDRGNFWLASLALQHKIKVLQEMSTDNAHNSNCSVKTDSKSSLSTDTAHM